MACHKNYNLNVDEGFVMYLTSEFMTCIIDSFTSNTKSESIAYCRSEHIYWNVDL